MSSQSDYQPPKVWKWDTENGGAFVKINRPTAGATHEKELPVGNHPLQLYSLATPNGVKVTIMLEELLALGYSDAEYDAWLCRIRDGDQFASGFVEANPNSKIPALIDHSEGKKQRVFESGAILLYLSEKFGEFIPTKLSDRTECLSWLFLANGKCTIPWRWFWTFLRIRSREISISNRSICHGNKTSIRSFKSTAHGHGIYRWIKVYDSRHGYLGLVWTTRAGASL